jgi:hypothetical protein
MKENRRPSNTVSTLRPTKRTVFMMGIGIKIQKKFGDFDVSTCSVSASPNAVQSEGKDGGGLQPPQSAPKYLLIDYMDPRGMKKRVKWHEADS